MRLYSRAHCFHLLLILLAALDLSTFSCAGQMLGSRIQLEVFYPDFDTPISTRPVKTITTSDIEFSNLAQYKLPGTLLVNVDIDFTDSSITITFTGLSGSFATAPVNTYVFTDIDDTMPDFTGFSIDTSVTTLGIQPSAVTFTKNQLFINVSSLSFNSTTFAKFNVSFITITSTTSATGRTGQFFAFQVLASGLSPAARTSATGLPPGLAIDDVSGLISGIPTIDGSFGVTVTVTDGNQTAVQTLDLTFTSDPAIPVITSPSTAALTPGQPFSYTIVAPTTTGPNDPTIFSIIGAVPAGLSFDPTTGTISGTPTSRSERILTLTPLIRALDDTPVVGIVQLVASNAEGTATKPLVFIPPAPNPLFNISTRLQVGIGDNVLIGGFVITGTEPKRVVLRAIGPSLANFNLSNVLANPTIDIFDKNSTKIATNDNWADSQKDDLIASGKTPTDGLESAVLMVLNPGAYTAIVRGNGNTTGLALVELFDLTPITSSTVTSSSVANISTRGFVQGGDNVMIGGFIVGPTGTGTAKVLVRAIGPSLANPPFNLTNVLQNPSLSLFDANGHMFATNDDWRTDQQADIIATGLPPSNDSESAIIATLTPGAYTAIVRGQGGANGIALVEVYALQ